MSVNIRKTTCVLLVAALTAGAVGGCGLFDGKAKEEMREPVLLPSFSAHILRHTFCTRLCENETNLKFIQSVMGHKDIQTTMDIYAEATEEKKQEIANNLRGKIIF